MSNRHLLEYSSTGAERRPRKRKTEQTEAPETIDPRIAQQIVYYPIFEKCMKYTNDQFWIDKLFRAARDKFPKYVKYSETFNTLRYSYRSSKKNISVYIPNDPAEAINIFINFFHAIGICSDLETEFQIQKTNFAIKTSKMKSPQNWSEVPESSKSVYIDSYVEEIATEMKLSLKQKKSLHNMIKLGISMGLLSKDGIKVENFHITQINGLYYDRKMRSFQIERRLWGKICSSPGTYESYDESFGKIPVKAKSKRNTSIYYTEWIKKTREFCKNVNTVYDFEDSKDKIIKDENDESDDEEDEIIEIDDDDDDEELIILD